MERLHSIKNWALDQRPRERLITKGPESLSKAELIAILIGSGTRDLSAIDVAQLILREAKDSITLLSQLSVKELCKIKGIGEAKAITIVAALELGKRRLVEAQMEKTSIVSSKDLFQLMQPYMMDLGHEEFWAVYLTKNMRVIEIKKIATGGIDFSAADIRIVFHHALMLKSVALAIVHNHPSGQLQPSDSDKLLTQKVSKAAEILSIQLIDHLILSNNSYFSFSDSNFI